jgi:anti-sigma B factor antagonist
MQKNENNTMTLETEIVAEDGNLILVNLNGKIIDQSTSQNLVTDITNLLSPEKNLIVLNLEKVEYINSNGLNSLISILTKTRTRGGELVLCNINEKVEKLLLITKLNSVFNIESSVEDAKQRLTTFKQN